jgi:hypothetical protein
MSEPTDGGVDERRRRRRQYGVEEVEPGEYTEEPLDQPRPACQVMVQEKELTHRRGQPHLHATLPTVSTRANSPDSSDNKG